MKVRLTQTYEMSQDDLDDILFVCECYLARLKQDDYVGSDPEAPAQRLLNQIRPKDKLPF